MTHILFLDPSKSSKRRRQAALPRRRRSVSVPYRAGPTTFAQVSVKSRRPTMPWRMGRAEAREERCDPEPAH